MVFLICKTVYTCCYFIKYIHFSSIRLPIDDRSFTFLPRCFSLSRIQLLLPFILFAYMLCVFFCCCFINYYIESKRCYVYTSANTQRQTSKIHRNQQPNQTIKSSNSNSSSQRRSREEIYILYIHIINK